jgi:hypothetical protein
MPKRKIALRKSAITVANTSEEPAIAVKGCGMLAEIPGNISTAMPAIIDRPSTSVRRASSSRDIMTCRPFMMMEVTANRSAASTIARGISENKAGSLGRNAAAKKATLTA